MMVYIYIYMSMIMMVSGLFLLYFIMPIFFRQNNTNLKTLHYFKITQFSLLGVSLLVLRTLKKHLTKATND